MTSRYDITLSEIEGEKTVLSVVKYNRFNDIRIEIELMEDNDVLKSPLILNAKEFKWFIFKIKKCFRRGHWINKNSEIYFEFPGENNMYLTLYHKRNDGYRVLWNFTRQDYRQLVKNRKLIFDLLYNFDAKIKELHNSTETYKKITPIEWGDKRLIVDELDEEPQTIDLY